ncbi:MAG: HPr family phosphocarrier protein [Candidatus Nanohaloarchaea archaeon]|nr:HPr family phosphocarrier protein [Candidatus Nanohaloarchaea archaeon]
MKREVEIVPEEGLHARPASKFVETANQFDCDLKVGKQGEEPVDARSMLSVTGLGAAQGDIVELIAEGDDAEEALDALEKVLTTPEDEYAD